MFVVFINGVVQTGTLPVIILLIYSNLSLSIETHNSFFQNAPHTPSSPPPPLPLPPPNLPSHTSTSFLDFNLQRFNSMAVSSAQEGCDAYSVVVLSEEGNTEHQCELATPLSSPHVPLKSQLSLDARLSNQSYINMMVENAVVDVDIETGKSEETHGNLKNEDGLTKSLQKQISFDMGGKYMQLLMNHILVLSKFSTRDKTATAAAAEKVVDAPRSRKYKRAASFNSRKIVLLFSVLSSLGTMILIYLTLRVRQAAVHPDSPFVS